MASIESNGDDDDDLYEISASDIDNHRWSMDESREERAYETIAREWGTPRSRGSLPPIPIGPTHRYDDVKYYVPVHLHTYARMRAL